MKDDNLKFKIGIGVFILIAILLMVLYQTSDDYDMNRFKTNYFKWEVTPDDAYNEWDIDTYYFPYADMLMFILPVFSVLIASFMITKEYYTYKNYKTRVPWLIGAIVLGLVSVTSFFWLETNKPRSGGLYDVRLDVFVNLLYVFVNVILTGWFSYNAIRTENKRLMSSLGLVMLITAVAVSFVSYHIYWFIGFVITICALLTLLVLGSDLRSEYLKIKE